jgi:RecA/RadA recombinase
MSDKSQDPEAGGEHVIPRDLVVRGDDSRSVDGHRHGVGGYKLELGDAVSPPDEENIGTIKELDESRALVHFCNKESGQEAEKWFPLDVLTLLRRARPPRELKILSFAEMMALRPGEFLVEGILRKGELAVIYGAPGCGKTFVTLDISLCVAVGRGWHGHRVHESPVVYVAAEAVLGLPPRVGAWLDERREHLERLEQNYKVVGVSVQFLDAEDFESFLARVRELPESPGLIVIDTLARCVAGGDENSSKDMGLLVRACDQLRGATGATVLLVHHSGKSGTDERGSSALRGAADTMMSVEKSGDLIKLWCTKQKEDKPFRPLEFGLEQADVRLDASEEPQTSCRLRLTGASGWASKSQPSLTDNERKILTEISQPLFGGVASRSALFQAVDITRATAYRTVNRLIEEGYLELIGAGRNSKIQITKKGKEVAVSPFSPSLKGSQEGESTSLTVSPPLKGGGPIETREDGNEAEDVLGNGECAEVSRPAQSPSADEDDGATKSKQVSVFVSPASDAIPEVCRSCRRESFHRLKGAPNWICSTCHPPDDGARVEERWAAGQEASGTEADRHE